MLSFGEETLSLAVLYTIVSTIPVSSVGIALLSEKSGVASGIVAFTTLLSALTLTLWIYIANLL